MRSRSQDRTENGVSKSPSGPYDAIVVGAGICGIVFLAYARRKGLRCIALEKQGDVGGLWNRLPAWQDLQNRRQDIAIDGVPLDGVDQPAVHRHLSEWVRRFELGPSIRLGREVTGTSRTDGHWEVRTAGGEVLRTRHLVVASGAQNDPWIPEVERSGSEIEEAHSSTLLRPADLAGKRITVVGGGASSQDLLELAIKKGAAEVHWVCRNTVKWFVPTRREKQKAWPNLRELGLGQAVNGTRFASSLMDSFLRRRYRRYRVSGLLPEEPFDFDRHQLIPGRAHLLANMQSVSLHRAEVQRMKGKEIALTDGERFETDQVLWATGFRMNLRYLDLPEYREIRRVADLLPRLGSLIRSLDYPDLYFVGMPLIDTSNSTPYFAALEAQTIISHMRGECTIPETVLPHRLTYWELVQYFSTFDRANYPRMWRLKYIPLALWYASLQNRGFRVAPR